MQPLFQPFRALGYISDDVPFSVQRRGKENFVTVGVGKAWQVCDKHQCLHACGLDVYSAAYLTCGAAAGVLLH